jgi:hypothetical protein
MIYYNYLDETAAKIDLFVLYRIWSIYESDLSKSSRLKSKYIKMILLLLNKH